MPESITINRNNKPSQEQDYYFLRRKGIGFIEDLSGSVWTDYNTHDPGITLLEAMCYALTDLGYRTSFEINDLLAPPNKASAETWKKIFYTAREVLPCNPLTPVDYRKLIIDTEGVRNAWIETSDDYEILLYLQKTQENPLTKQSYNLTYDNKKGEDVLFLRGLYKVFVEYEDDIINEKRDEVAKIIWQKLQFHRNLTEDFISVSSIEYELFPIEAVIQVSEGADIETITATIYKVIHDFFSPPVSFYSLAQMLERQQGNSPEDIFEGPVLNYGFIDTAELEKSEQFKSIHLSDIINLISDINGVIAVKKFTFPVESQYTLSNFTEWITTLKDKQKTPKLDIEKSSITFERSGDRNRHEEQKQVNKEKVNAIYSFLKSDNFKTRLRGSGKDLPLPQGEFMNVADYFPFQKNLPAVYGMSETFINDSVDKISVEAAIRELLAEKIGVNGARLVSRLLNESKHKERLENIFEGLMEGSAINTSIIREIIDLEWEEGVPEKPLKKIINELLGDDPHYTEDRSHVYKFVEHQVEYTVPSPKSRALYELSLKKLKKSLIKIDSNSEIAKLESLYRKYQVNRLEKRKKLTLQLRGFLMIFEQILADYLSQLSHAREIFSFDENVSQVFYPQVVKDIGDMEALFIDFNHFRDSQLKMMETPEDFISKRNNVLDHLLARFSESMDKYSYFMRQFAGKEAGKRLITDKVAFLSDYVQVSNYRGKGYNYIDPDNHWNSNNVEGLKKRICRLLGIKNYKREKIAPTALFIEEIKLDTGVKRYVALLVDPENRTSVLLRSIEYEFPGEAQLTLTYILENGYDESLYEKKGRGDKWHFELRQLTPENDYQPVAHSRHYDNSNERDNALKKIIKTLDGFSEDENFHIVEHILLRPKIWSLERGNASDDVALLPVEYVPDKISFVDEQEKDIAYKFKVEHIKEKGKKSLNLWRLSLVKGDNEILTVNEDFPFYRDLRRRIKRIREGASDIANYVPELTKDGSYKYKIMAGKTILAESKKKNFQNKEDAYREAKNLVDYFSYQLDPDTGSSEENSPSFYADPYSFQLSIILPKWQRRFRNSTFKHLVEKTIYLETPSHIYAHVYWADHHQMKEFDRTYELWVKEIATNDIPATDVVNDMINALTKLRN